MTIRWVTRDDMGWGPTPAVPAPCDQGLVLHYDGVNRQLASRPHSACVSYWQATRDYHVNTRGWSDIGYSYGACPHGYIHEGRGLRRIQAAQQGGNTSWHSVTTMSGPDEDITALQIQAIRELHNYLVARGIGSSQRGHRDFNETACPGDIVYNMLRDGTLSPGADLPEVPDMPEYVYIVDTLPVPLTLGAWHSIAFDEERSDVGGNHTPGAQTFCGGAQYSGTVQVHVSGLDSGSEIFLRVVQDDSDGETVVTHSRGGRTVWMSVPYFTFPFTGRVATGRRAKIQVMAEGSGAPVLESAVLNAHIWPL